MKVSSNLWETWMKSRTRLSTRETKTKQYKCSQTKNKKNQKTHIKIVNHQMPDSRKMKLNHSKKPINQNKPRKLPDKIDKYKK